MSNIAKFWNKHQWVDVSASKLAKHYPLGLPIHFHSLICPCCQQFLTLVCSQKKVPYFRHSSSELDKDCELRANSYAREQDFNPGERQFPIKIFLSKGKIRFSIGLFRVSQECLSSEFDFDIDVIVDIPQKDVVNRHFSSERLLAGSMTYLPICDKPPLQVMVRAPNETQWPSDTRMAVRPWGSLFSADSGKLLPQEAEITVGQKYLLILKEGEFKKNDFRGAYNLNVRSLNVPFPGWELYECQATALDNKVALFFLKYSANLTDQPVKLNAIWPISNRQPYEIHSPEKRIFIVSTKGLILKMWPKRLHKLEPDVESAFSFVDLHEVEVSHDPILSLGKRTLLKFVQARICKDDSPSLSPQAPVVKLENNSGQEIQSETLLSLKDNILFCTVNRNASFVVYKEQSIINMGVLRPDKEAFPITLRKGEELKIFFGRDLVRVLSIITKVKAQEGKRPTHCYPYLMTPLNASSPHLSLAYTLKYQGNKSALKERSQALTMPQFFDLLK